MPAALAPMPAVNGDEINNKVKAKLAEKKAAKKKTRKQAKKQQKREGSVVSGREGSVISHSSGFNGDATDTDNDDADASEVEIEYVTEAPLGVAEDSTGELAGILERFAARLTRGDDIEEKPEDTPEEAEKKAAEEAIARKLLEDNDDEDKSDDDEADEEKRAKKANRMSVAELKQVVKKPEVVEWVDITATDPITLVHLKSYRNTVPVPIHWQQKRKYLQGKRGIEKPPFELPDFIKATGIMEMRSAVKDKEDATKLKSKTRERHAPKMGKLSIDYQKLHDAFFRLQTKPRFTIHGDLYYEGKEFETKPKLTKPGVLSEDLKQALGIPPLAPPPWLINMQRYGPPPSYPSLKISGLNAPIPAGAQWGYHPGGWGKPPVDEYNRPLYGDVFGVTQVPVAHEHVAPIERALWGEMEEEEYEEEEEVAADEEEEEEEEGVKEEGLATPVIEAGLVTPSGLASSVPSGLETPEFIELRKDRRTMDEQPKSLYTVIPERATNISGFMGSERVYDISAAQAQAAAVASTSMPDQLPRKRKGFSSTPSGVEVALNPEDMMTENGVLDSELLKKRYEETLEERAAANPKEDFSDLVAEHAQKQSKKRKTDTGGSKKGKEKEFKF
ncbi:hypothetical protein SmJEL517_g05463 [Synchytrium microbalum]|uniref:PSP proline-rich domain-containing protein n=1 Tax=Synchytrium microbalum TaxID=1806994 RepID=A0A507BZB7_9FUNG|nr:uncharacterized protein SmJEL517_g05463 [Synchytrium microbalum]TPX31144.1 hypothetical protein SmJEL517_g05463 [Synchytrium microbalum]